jgi:hypothetical protein
VVMVSSTRSLFRTAPGQIKTNLAERAVVRAAGSRTVRASADEQRPSEDPDET